MPLVTSKMVPRMASRMGFCGSLPSCSASCPSVSRFSGTTYADPRLLHEQGVSAGLLGKPSLLSWLRQLPQRWPLLRHHLRKNISRNYKNPACRGRRAPPAAAVSTDSPAPPTISQVWPGTNENPFSIADAAGAAAGLAPGPVTVCSPLFGMPTAGRMPAGAQPQGSLAVLGGHADATALL